MKGEINIQKLKKLEKDHTDLVQNKNEEKEVEIVTENET